LALRLSEGLGRTLSQRACLPDCKRGIYDSPSVNLVHADHLHGCEAIWERSSDHLVINNDILHTGAVKQLRV
jgi:hypothetical protein